MCKSHVPIYIICLQRPLYGRPPPTHCVGQQPVLIWACVCVYIIRLMVNGFTTKNLHRKKFSAALKTDYVAHNYNNDIADRVRKKMGEKKKQNKKIILIFIFLDFSIFFGSIFSCCYYYFDPWNVYNMFSLFYVLFLIFIFNDRYIIIIIIYLFFQSIIPDTIS